MRQLSRVLEKEVMDDPQEATEYDTMDHSEVNRKFVSDLMEVGEIGSDILDLGTGTALIPIELCQRLPDVRVMACDAAVSMLELARYHLEIESLTQRIQLYHGDAKSLRFADNYFDAVISNTLLHHLPEPGIVLREIVRVLRPGGVAFVRDLARPDTDQHVEDFVLSYAQGESLAAQQLFRQSFHASLRLDETQNLVQQLGFSRDSVKMTSDRHWTWIARKPIADQQQV